MEEWEHYPSYLIFLIKREDILVELYNHLQQKYGDLQHNIRQGCYVTILNRI